MRDIVLYTLLSLDGVAEEPGNWMSDTGPEVFENLRSVISTQDDVVLGRGTYEYWAGYWPQSDVQPFSDFINTTPKHVFSSQALTESWANARQVTAPLGAYLEDLAGKPGGDIGVHGSISVARSLLRLGMIDRLELVIAPTLAGTGQRLFVEGITPQRMVLTNMDRSSGGAAFLRYQRA